MNIMKLSPSKSHQHEVFINMTVPGFTFLLCGILHAACFEGPKIKYFACERDFYEHENFNIRYISSHSISFNNRRSLDMDNRSDNQIDTDNSSYFHHMFEGTLIRREHHDRNYKHNQDIGLPMHHGIGNLQCIAKTET